MGKMKKKANQRPNINGLGSIPTEFSCPFCNHETSCSVKLDKSRNTGKITCRICMECFQTPIHALSHPIDVYNDWIDECERLNP